ncbi:uncharacterized protein FIBRA_08583 [Fibroporia radiculosa]|uniref:Ricin B lectin domain-containing protein n=1 Tax=Fibroporia radiculosa TaxID=599839 RepID=J4GX26_9APHY|nr:uncharacterized protein FIBRA_08583 [Fibroporia radiculosa]CCM06330.1 predicted protein [Fibroporia radiculosa]
METHLSGVVTITNAQYHNRVRMLNDDDGEPLFCVVPTPQDSPRTEELWKLEAGDHNRYRLINVKYDEYDAVAHHPHKVKAQVLASHREDQWWLIERVKDKDHKNAYLFVFIMTWATDVDESLF